MEIPPSVPVAMTRIRNRLDKGKKPVAPPTLQVGPAPFEHLTEEIMLSRDSLIVILKSDIQFVVQQARYIQMYNIVLALHYMKTEQLTLNERKK